MANRLLRRASSLGGGAPPAQRQRFESLLDAAPPAPSFEVVLVPPLVARVEVMIAGSGEREEKHLHFLLRNSKSLI